MKSFYGYCVAYHTYDFLFRSKNHHDVITELGTLTNSIVDECGVFSCVTGPNVDALYSPQHSIQPQPQPTSQPTNHGEGSGADSVEDAHPSCDGMTPSDQSHDGYGQTPLEFTRLSSDAVVTSYQSGICRVNCIDCCDRTNVGMYILAKRMLARQLHTIRLLESYPLLSADRRESTGVVPSSDPPSHDTQTTTHDTPDPPSLAPSDSNPHTPPLLSVVNQSANTPPLPSTLTQLLQFVFTEHGDRISYQYTGTPAMHKELLFTRDYETKQWSHLPLYLPRRVIHNVPSTKVQQVTYRKVYLDHIKSLPHHLIPPSLLHTTTSLPHHMGDCHRDPDEHGGTTATTSPSANHPVFPHPAPPPPPQPQQYQRSMTAYLRPSLSLSRPHNRGWCNILHAIA